MSESPNISPEMINNLVNMLKNSNNNESSEVHQDTNKTDNSDPNLSDLFSKFTQNNNSNNDNSEDSTSNSIDFETILKMKNIMETLNNKDDQNSKLLYSLKPYLRKSKQAKLDQYVNLLKITQISNIFKNQKGD